jgi:hypothetical protein
MIDAAVDQCLNGAQLIRQNERTWRAFHDRVEASMASAK